jgi:NAD(P)-dependent dehydrogenase (short-subunit alcohol dehydrogenase family)
MSKQLENKTAVVTGASRGIGRAIALKLAGEGATVIAHYGSSKQAAEELVAEIKKNGGNAKAVGADLNSPDGAAKLAAAVDNLDILVNNAGVAELVPFEGTTEAQFDKLFNVNVKSLFFVTQKLAPKIKDGGRIINISSVAGRIALPGIAAYSSTKAAVNSLSRAFAVELGARKINVNAVAPGAIDTDMAQEFLSGDGAERMKAMQALKRIGQPDDIADAVVSLAGPAGRWITGQVIEVSGGANL